MYVSLSKPPAEAETAVHRLLYGVPAAALAFTQRSSPYPSRVSCSCGRARVLKRSTGAYRHTAVPLCVRSSAHRAVYVLPQDAQEAPEAGRRLARAAKAQLDDDASLGHGEGRTAGAAGACRRLSALAPFVADEPAASR